MTTEERKKRAAERQITKDDKEENNDTVTEPSRGFPKADEETLKKRRIVKVKHVASNQDEEKKSNPFANLSSKSVFGSGYAGGFGTSSSGFGSGGGGFSIGSSFGNTASQGANSSTASVFGSAFSGGIPSTTSSESAFGAPNQAVEQQVAFPEQVDLKTGEEDEVCILELRAKSHVLVEKQETKQTEQVDDSVHSVPPSSSNVSAADAKGEIGNKESAEESKQAHAQQAEAGDEKPKEPQEESTKKEGESTNAKEEPKKDAQEEPASAKEEPKKDAQKNVDAKEKAQDTKKQQHWQELGIVVAKEKAQDTKKKQQDWQELGIGPLRILKKDKSHTRVVQRRESAVGGAGTKLLINAALPKESKVGRPSDQHVRFTTIEPSGKAAIYLLKVKTKAEANQLQQVLEKEIAQASSFVEN